MPDNDNTNVTRGLTQQELKTIAERVAAEKEAGKGFEKASSSSIKGNGSINIGRAQLGSSGKFNNTVEYNDMTVDYTSSFEVASQTNFDKGSSVKGMKFEEVAVGGGQKDTVTVQIDNNVLTTKTSIEIDNKQHVVNDKKVEINDSAFLSTLQNGYEKTLTSSTKENMDAAIRVLRNMGEELAKRASDGVIDNDDKAVLSTMAKDAAAKSRGQGR